MIFSTRTLSLALGAGALAIAALAPAVAQQGAGAGAASVTAGTYAMDGGHSQVLFSYRHFGLTTNIGVLSSGTGSLTIDPKNSAATKLSVEVPISSLKTSIAKLDEELQAKEWFDAAQFPTAKFVSTKVTVDGESAEVEGNLTIHGVTKPATLSVDFDAAGVNPMSKKQTVSFKATGLIKRSEFGIGQYVPNVSDEVGLNIVAAFEK